MHICFQFTQLFLIKYFFNSNLFLKIPTNIHFKKINFICYWLCDYIYDNVVEGDQDTLLNQLLKS